MNATRFGIRRDGDNGYLVVDSCNRIGNRSRMVDLCASYSEADLVCRRMNRLDAIAWRLANRLDMPAKTIRRMARRSLSL